MNTTELNRKQALAKVVNELDRLYPQDGYDAAVLASTIAAPDFITTRSGHNRQFTREASLALGMLCYAWTKEVPKLAIRMDVKELLTCLRQAVCDLHADRLLDGSESENLKLLDDTVNKILESSQVDFVHSFPAWTLGMEYEHPFVVGPVSIMSRNQWLDSVDFNDYAKKAFVEDEERNHHWKEALREVLARPTETVEEGEKPLPMLASFMYGPLRSAPSLLRISLSGYEARLSRKAARHICKTTLDGLSLFLGGKELFHQQTLSDERMPPVDHHTIVESKGFLHAPGYGLNKQIRIMAGKRVKDQLTQDIMRPRLDALSHILHSLVSPEEYSHPQLAMRWAMALDWLAEGERESSEAIALAKIGTSLDVLTEGGKFGGILNMITHLTGKDEKTIVQVGPIHRDLRWLIREIYDNGRSKILHGNVFDRLQSFADIRLAASSLARLVLIECAVRLKSYRGPDSSKAFRDIPNASPAEESPQNVGR